MLSFAFNFFPAITDEMHYFLIFFLLICPLCHASSAEDLKKIIQKYIQNSGVKMNFKKNTHLKILKKIKKSQGQIFMSKGSIALKVKDSLNTRIVSDKKYLWYITAPHGKKKQTVKIDLKNVAGGEKVFLSFLFSSKLLFQKFRFISSRPKGRTWILDFKPIEDSSEIHSFSVKIDGNLILKAWLKWKNLGNEEEYTFSDIRFNQKVLADHFQI